jgi:hypothetical protein
MAHPALPQWMRDVDLATIPPNEHDEALAKLYGYWTGGLLTDEQVYILSTGHIVPQIEREAGREKDAAHSKRGINPKRDQAAVDLALTVAQSHKKRIQSLEKDLQQARDRLDEAVRAAHQKGASSSEIARALGWSRQMVNLVVRGRPSRATGKPRGRPKQA